MADYNTAMNPIHESLYMQQAIQLAECCTPDTAPNPRVGCVIVKNDTVIGVGYTQKVGSDHAEVQALKDARAKGHDVQGATVYVTLEPCNHFGRTPPCTEALIQAGIAKVVAAIEDPNPLVAGAGLARLKAAGVDVEVGVLSEAAREINLGFLSRMQRGKPWVRMKVAASLDGKTALLNGQSQWITSQQARDDGHVWRARAGAILTGIGTVKKDDPQLTVRLNVNEENFLHTRQPQRIVVDSNLKIATNARVLVGGNTLIVTAIDDAKKQAALETPGVEVMVLPNVHGKVDLPQLMLELGKRAINELHVEAGATLNGALLREGCVDELLLYLAPSVLGQGQGMFDLPVISSLEDKASLKFQEIKKVGEDIRILARLHPGF